VSVDCLGFLPEAFRRGVESALGIPPPAPGEGTRWHLEFTPYLRDAASDPWLAGAIALGAALLVFFVYRNEGSTAGAAYRVLMGGVRLFLVLLTLAVPAPPPPPPLQRPGLPRPGGPPRPPPPPRRA